MSPIIIIEKVFCEFLATQGITASFSLELKNKTSMPYQSITIYLQCILGIGSDPRDIIQKAFCWTMTEAGKDYWKRHNTNWIEYYTNSFLINNPTGTINQRW
jgi:hypothetical protein